MQAQPFPDHPFTTAQAAQRGISRNRLCQAVQEGAVRRLFTAVYLRSDVELTTLVRAQAAQLVMSEHSVLCDRTAAWIHGIDVFRYAELETMPSLESYVLRGHDPTDRKDCHGGTRDLLPEDWQVIGGVRVTTPARTAVDLACKLSRREALAALDAFAREHGLTIEELQRLLWRYRRRRGVIQARALVPVMDGGSESSGESWTRGEIRDSGLPPPKLQHWVNVDGVPTYRLDLAYPHARIAIEYDGENWHSTPEQRAHDEERRAWLRAHGWLVIVVTKESFADPHLHRWISQLRYALKDRGVHLPN